jgi:hypothetical protein
MERCEANYYLDHGVPEAETSDERTDRAHLVSSVLVNALLALIALVIAGLFSRRRIQ